MTRLKQLVIKAKPIVPKPPVTPGGDQSVRRGQPIGINPGFPGGPGKPGREPPVRQGGGRRLSKPGVIQIDDPRPVPVKKTGRGTTQPVSGVPWLNAAKKTYDSTRGDTATKNAAAVAAAEAARQPKAPVRRLGTGGRVKLEQKPKKRGK